MNTYQQIHRKCGGTIIVVYHKDDKIVFACNKCGNMFKYDIRLPRHKEWRDINMKEGAVELKTLNNK